MSHTSHTCINCGYSSLVRSNFKFTIKSKPYCVKKCSEVYAGINDNLGARVKGDKVE